MLSPNKRFQRITVGVIIGVVVISLALSLLSVASAAPLSAPGLVGSGDPLPVTKTPQGTSTQVTDEEHLGGLVGFLVFMLGGALLLFRSRRRQRRERAREESESILSRP